MNFHYFPGCRAPWVIIILQVKIVVIDSCLLFCSFVMQIKSIQFTGSLQLSYYTHTIRDSGKE